MSTPTASPNTAKAAVVEEGFFGSESLFVTFGCTREAMQSAIAKFEAEVQSGTSRQMPSDVKTYVHELTHYVHYTTTPYGLFLQYCRDLQSQATTYIVRALLEARIPFRQPLIDNIPADMPEDVAQTVRGYLSIWINIENLVAMLHGDSDRRAELVARFVADGERVRAGQKPLLPPLHDLQETFFMVQNVMADMLVANNSNAKANGSPVPMDPAHFDVEALRQELATRASAGDRADLRMQDGLDILGGFYDVENIIESAATVAEFWGSSISYEDFVAWLDEDVDPELRVYRSSIRNTLESIHTRSVPEAVMTYMALCEMAFYAPLLPHHAALRMKHPGLRQILPIHRWMSLIQAVSSVQPMRSPQDYARFATDICRILGWVHPLEIISTAVLHEGTVSNPLAVIYLQAQRMRAQDMSAFFGLDHQLSDPSPEGQAWRLMFNFVILAYSDVTMYHPDSGFADAMITRRLNMLGMRAFMLSPTMRIRAPYRAGAEQLQWMSEWLRDRFRAVLGVSVDKAQFV